MSNQYNIKRTVRINEETDQRLDELAEQSGESKNAVMRKILVDAVSDKNSVIDYDTRRKFLQASACMETAKTIYNSDDSLNNDDLYKSIEKAENMLRGVIVKWNK